MTTPAAAARLTSETAAASSSEGARRRRSVYLGPRLDAPPMDVFEGAILFDEPGVKAVEFSSGGRTGSILRATSGAEPARHLGRRAPEIALRAGSPIMQGSTYRGRCRQMVRGGSQAVYLSLEASHLPLHRSGTESWPWVSRCDRPVGRATSRLRPQWFVRSHARRRPRALRDAAPVPRYAEPHRCRRVPAPAD